MLADVSFHIIKHDATLRFGIFEKESQFTLASLGIKHHFLASMMSLRLILRLDFIQVRTGYRQQHKLRRKKIQEEFSFFPGIGHYDSPLFCRSLVYIVNEPFVYHCYLFFLVLPICIEIFLQLSAIEHLVAQQAGILQWGNVLAHTVVELRIVAAGKEGIYLVGKLM